MKEKCKCSKKKSEVVVEGEYKKTLCRFCKTVLRSELSVEGEKKEINS